ncbi:MAG: hypothetical protein E6K69_08020 [Nitrospirae bacterium]|nr:MAG: hypothetical protein E6K69_08020 [Nitrospirota bacterium]
MKIDLQIGGYLIGLKESENHNCIAWPLRPFEGFLTQSENVLDLDIQIEVVKQLPEISRGALTFDACQGLWKLYEAAPGYILDSADTETLEPRTRSIISGDFSRIRAWVCEHHSELGDGWMILQVINPLVEVCLLTKLAREGGVLLHAAGILTETGVLAFTGSSGAGKSTLSEFFAAKGACILSDERIIIKRVSDGFAVYGTPWVGTSLHAHNRAGSLTRLYCIRHGLGSHMTRRMSPRAFSQFVLRQCFLPHWDRAAMDNTLAFLGTLIEKVDCFELAFMNTPDIVEFLEEQRLEHSVASS